MDFSQISTRIHRKQEAYKKFMRYGVDDVIMYQDGRRWGRLMSGTWLRCHVWNVEVGKMRLSHHLILNLKQFKEAQRKLPKHIQILLQIY